MPSCVLVVDQGTTSTRAIVFGADGSQQASVQDEFPQAYPQAGWVEHDPDDLWETTIRCMRGALEKAQIDASGVAAIGLANQRETTLLWDRKSGQPIHNAIVWQDRRTAETCAALKAQGAEALATERTGLLLDPYFSATKISWMLDHVPGARQRAERGELAFGTVDAFLLWRMTGGAVHATDATNASRTLLFNIHKQRWDDELLKLFRVPASVLPEVKDTAGRFGVLSKEHLGAAIPILAIAGDQQAALIGQACLEPGMVKATFGTGAFVLINTGPLAVPSSSRMLTTIAYRWTGQTAYALEGSVFSAGATVQWLRDSLGIISSSAESGDLAAKADPESGVYLAPAFTGLGAPYWDAEARGTIVGLTRGAGRNEIARAALESVAYQTRDLIDSMAADWAASGATGGASVVRADGGLSASDWTMQFLADQLAAPVDRPVNRETTAQGVAFLALWQSGLMPGPEDFAKAWRLERRFEPAMSEAERARRHAGWRKAVAQCRLRV